MLAALCLPPRDDGLAQALGGGEARSVQRHCTEWHVAVARANGARTVDFKEATRVYTVKLILHKKTNNRMYSTKAILGDICM